MVTTQGDKSRYSVTVALESDPEKRTVRWGSLNSDGDVIHFEAGESWARDILEATMLYLDTIGSIFSSYTMYQEGLAPSDNSAGDKEGA